jgi:hypothetical protein
MNNNESLNSKEEIKSENEQPRIHLNDGSLITNVVEVEPRLIRAYCPKCGREIVSSPMLYNPFTFEGCCSYDCECGLHAELDHAYPRILFVDADNNEYEAYTK